jgi:CHAT domain
MRFLGAAAGELSVLDLSSLDSIADALSGASSGALEIDDRWYLLDPDDLERLEAELRESDRPQGVLGDYREAMIVGPGEQPFEPAVVVHAGDVLGAWVLDETRGGGAGVEAGSASGGGSGEAAKPRKISPDSVLFGDSPRLKRRRFRRRASAPSPRSEPPPPSAEPPPSPSPPGAPVERREMAVPAAPVPEAAGAHPEPVAGPPEPPSGPPETIERTPHMDGPERIAMKPGSSFDVSVYADTTALRAGEEGEGIEIELPEAVDEVEIGVLLQLSEQFEASADGEFGRLTIKRDEDKSSTATFEVRVADDPPPGTAVINALLTLRGRSCGQVSRAWWCDGKEAEAKAADPPLPPPVSTSLHVNAAEADLSIFVTAPENDGVHYHCVVQTPHLADYQEPKSEPFAVPANGYGFIEGLLDAITANDRPADERLRALKIVGHEAWEAAPEIVKRILWKMVDEGVRLETINIASVEPVLPWELMIPRRFDGGNPRRLGPLGVEFAIGRWTRSDGQEPPPKLPIVNSVVVAPAYENKEMRLDSAEEVAYVIDKLRGAQASPATIAGLDARFAKEHASLVHFVCHGDTKIEGDDAILLEHDETLKARDTEALGGFEEMFQAVHPFVFLNSCNTGRPVPSLAGSSGFPRSFGNIGAHAIVAPLWPVADELAKKIAIELYEGALAPGAQPVATVLRDIRKRAYEAEDADTYAAYCFFGDPLARLELVNQA